MGRFLRGMDFLLSKLSPATVERWGVAVALTIGVVHYALAPELSVAALYLLPILVAVLYGTGRAGYFICALSTGIWLCADLLAHEEVPLPGVIAWNTAIQASVFIAVAFLASRLRESREHQRHFALSDPLTGLANTRAFFDRLKVEVDRALRYGTVFTLVYMDLDRFKEVNDTLGHAEGNRVLLLVADTVGSSMRSTDLVARLGGDEFGMLLPETPFGQAEAALTKLRGQILLAMEEKGWPVTLSLGAVTFETPTSTADDAVRIADHLMYQVKDAGGDGIRHILWTGEEVEAQG